jgi:hypothetical protein
VAMQKLAATASMIALSISLSLRPAGEVSRSWSRRGAAGRLDGEFVIGHGTSAT